MITLTKLEKLETSLWDCNYNMELVDDHCFIDQQKNLSHYRLSVISTIRCDDYVILVHVPTSVSFYSSKVEIALHPGCR